MDRQPAERDDDALNWAGDDDPTLDVRDRRDAGVTGAQRAGSRAQAPVAATDAAPASAPVSTPTTAPASAPAPASATSAGARASTPAPVPADSAVTPDARAQMSSAALVAVSVLSGILLLYTVGWFVAVQRIGTGSSDVLHAYMLDVGRVLAVAAAPMWFVASFFATRGRGTRWFVIALIVGALVLIPWPLLIGSR